MVIAALLACAAAGCFTDPINRQPQVTLKGLTTPQRKQVLAYTAQVTDPDNDQRPEKTMWAEEPGPCAEGSGPASWPPSSDWFRSMPDPVALMFDDQTDKTTVDAPFCLWVFATDSHGAMNADHLAIVPQDQAPTPVISVVAPDRAPNSMNYPLYSTIELSSNGSSDHDDGLPSLNWSWTIQAPDGTQVTPIDCNGHDKCSFTALAPGTYQATLVATDPKGEMGTTQPLTIGVNTDQPPCIQGQTVTPTFQVTMPIKPPVDNMLTIGAVADDGNPTPAGPMGRTHFRWFISSKSGVGLVPDDNDRNQLELVGYNAGDLVKVRVEATDGTQTTEDALFACQDSDVCTYPLGSGCFLRLTWSIQF